MLVDELRAMLTTSNKPINVKYHNQKLILSLFRQAESLSIAEVGKRTKLSKTTVAKVICEFVAKGLLVPAGKGASTDVGGKKPERFAFNPTFSHIIPLVITRERMLGALTDLKCNLLFQQEVECNLQVDYHSAVAKMAGMVRDLLRDANLEPQNICSVIVGCEGIVDVENNTMHYTLHHAWGYNLPIGKDLAGLLSFPVNVLLNNNVRLAGYAHLLEEPDQYDTVVVINSYRSTGGCVIEAKQPVHGMNGYVGEFGHMILEPYSDVKCDCGCYGCFGALVSPDLLLATANKLFFEHPQSLIYPKARDGSLAIEDIFAASNENDSFACFLLDRVIYYFAILIHNIVLLRDPVEVIIQGIYSSAGDYFLKTLQKKVNSFPFYKVERTLPILYSSIAGFEPYLVGAAYFAVDEFFSSNTLYD